MPKILPPIEIGGVIDSWTVIEKIDDPEKGVCYKVQCVCGNYNIKKHSSVRARAGKQCSDCQYKNRKSPPGKNRNSPYDISEEIGKKYNKWTVIKFLKFDELNRKIFELECECGFRRYYDIAPVRNEKSKQCDKCQKKWLKEHRKKLAQCMKNEKNPNE